MPRIPIFRLGSPPEPLEQPRLEEYAPVLSLEGLQLGVDNLRHDVYLSPKFVEQIRLHVSRLVLRHGGLEGLLAAETADRGPRTLFIGSIAPPVEQPRIEPAELKPLLTSIQTSSLNMARAAQDITIDVLGRVSVLKFLRFELNSQFNELLERCRMTLKNYEGVRQQKALEYRETVAAFQVAKKIILRKAGMELFHTLREVERETLSRMRQSYFGSHVDAVYKLFLNPLIFTEDGRDTYLNAEQYVMLGNFDKDPDRYLNIRRVALALLQSLDIGPEAEDEATLDRWLSVPENSHELVGTGGIPNESTLQGRSQKARLQMWVELLEREGLMEYVVASYEAVPLLAEYSPRINAQQLKNALVSKEERDRVERLIQEHGRMSPESFRAAVSRASGSNAAGRAKMAARFLYDFMRYQRDFRRLQAVNAAFDSVNLIGSPKLRELSSMNGTLYEFLLPEEQRSYENAVRRHVILKADVRDSTRLTRSLLERGLNPASYFSLNFYDPVNKLLAKYGASKVFLEGDALILTVLESEQTDGLAVARTCVLAREIIEIVRGYNELLQRSGLFSLELGVGISYQDSAPMYLMDGEDHIMISDALNESDRLSSCNKRVRKPVEELGSPFNVYAFQTVGDADAGESPDDFILKYNLSGIRMSETAFLRLQEEITLEPCALEVPQLWGGEDLHLFLGLVPLGGGIFKKLVVRASRMPQVSPKDFSLIEWTDKWYYEVCSNPAIYAALEASTATAT